MTTFRFNPRPETWVNVSLKVPTERGIEVQNFRAKFLIPPLKEREEIFALGDTAWIGKVWLDWEGIADVDGKPIPFSAALRDELVEFEYILFAISEAFSKAMVGIEAKN